LFKKVAVWDWFW